MASFIDQLVPLESTCSLSALPDMYICMSASLAPGARAAL
jgi:hypothetical protein